MGWRCLRAHEIQVGDRVRLVFPPTARFSGYAKYFEVIKVERGMIVVINNRKELVRCYPQIFSEILRGGKLL